MTPHLDFQFSLRVFTDSAPQSVVLALSMEELVDDEMEDFVTEEIQHFANVVNHGGLSGASINVEASSMNLEDAVREDTHNLTFRADVAGVDPGAWRVLCGLLTALSYYSFPLRSVRITSSDGRERSVLTENKVWSIPYPSHPTRLPFTLERQEIPDTTRDRLVQIQLYHRPDERTFAEIEGALLSWDAVSNGGYPDEESEPIESATDAVEAYLIDFVTVEHPLPGFLGSEAAFDAVVCMAVWFHRRLAEVKSVRIE